MRFDEFLYEKLRRKVRSSIRVVTSASGHEPHVSTCKACSNIFGAAKYENKILKYLSQYSLNEHIMFSCSVHVGAVS